jgi:carnitine O-palmitoyltransferase 2
VLDKHGKILKPEEVLGCFQHILNSNDGQPEFPVGVLTSENRDTWAGLRAHLETLPGNQEALDLIDSALYCIALDDAKYSDEDEMSVNFLSGDAKNRWFDKNYTIMLDQNGTAALNFEHSWGDGVAVLRLFNELFDDTIKNKFVNSETKPSMDKSNSVKRLEFKLDDTLKAGIRQAQVTYKKSTEALHLKNFELAYGRDVPKRYKLSPDSWMQSGIQCAYYKAFKTFTATYESASTSAFKKGRTETIRPVTPATIKLAEYMSKHSNATIDSNEFLQLMRDCTKIHNNLVKEGAMGQGFDRHLFALKYHAVNRKGQTLPEFYNSFGYKFINHNCLSTSTLAYPTILTGGFAPVVHDGFGVGYRILAHTLGACVTSYDKNRLNAFVSELSETFDRIEKILKRSTLDNDKKKD